MEEDGKKGPAETAEEAQGAALRQEAVHLEREEDFGESFFPPQVETVPLNPGMLKIRSLPIHRRPKRKATRGKSC